MSDYDQWKTADLNDRWPNSEDEDGCTCPRELGAGGVRKTDRDCPLHGEDPDEAYERMRDDQGVL